MMPSGANLCYVDNAPNNDVCFVKFNLVDGSVALVL